jgi:hypothetical protein
MYPASKDDSRWKKEREEVKKQKGKRNGSEDRRL